MVTTEETGGRMELRVSLTLHHALPGASGEPPWSGSSPTFAKLFPKTLAVGPISDLHISLCKAPFLVIFSPLENLFNILHIRIKNY